MVTESVYYVRSAAISILTKSSTAADVFVVCVCAFVCMIVLLFSSEGKGSLCA